MEKENILKELEPLFVKAEKEGLWFYSQFMDIWFTPEALKKAQDEGRFVWGAVNWELKSPFDKLSELENQKKAIEYEIDSLKSKIQS